MAWFTDKYILWMLLIFPLFTGLSGYRHLTRSKFLFFAISTAIWLLVLLILALPNFLRTRRLPRPTTVQALILGFLALACISALCSPYNSAVLLGAGRYDGLVTLLLYGGIFLGISATGRPRQRYGIALALSTTFCCLVALLQLLGKNPLNLFPGNYTYYDAGLHYSGAFLGTIGNTNLLSAFLCLSIPMFVALFVQEDTPICFLFLMASAFSLFVLGASRVAGGLLAIPAALAISGLALLRSLRAFWRAVTASLVLACAASLGLSLTAEPGLFVCSPLPLLFLPLAALTLSVARRKKRIPYPQLAPRLAIALTITAAFGLLLLWFWPITTGTIYELHQILHGQIEDSFGSSRIRIWRETLALVQEYPWLGGGPDTLPLRLDIQFSRYVPETGQTLKTTVDNAHNEFLGYLVNLGLPALVLYFAALLSTLRRHLLRGKTSNAVALSIGLLSYWFQSFFGLGLCIVVPLVWILWGLTETHSSSNSNCADFAIPED